MPYICHPEYQMLRLYSCLDKPPEGLAEDVLKTWGNSYQMIILAYDASFGEFGRFALAMVPREKDCLYYTVWPADVKNHTWAEQDITKEALSWGYMSKDRIRIIQVPEILRAAVRTYLTCGWFAEDEAEQAKT